ncbi:MAG: 50S ribosomal protein L3 [Cyanobacteria bacterium]|nr:50S ribosomal protein L3 [Cyanobacteriota bacterium]
MTQVFLEDGSAVPVTVVELLPLTVTQVKTNTSDGYTSVQVGYGEVKAKHLSRAQQKHLTNKELPLFRKLKEFRVVKDQIESFKVGDQIDPSFITAEVLVNVTGHSIGKGFQGVTKRWNHHRGPMSHGSKSHRLPGSIGAGTTPGRVFKGLNMAGKMGNETVTVKNLKVIRVIPEKNVVLIKGAVPGVEGGYLTIKPKRANWNEAR